MLSRKQKLSEFRWSSYPDYLKVSAQRPGWLRVDRLLGEHAIPRDSAAGREQFEKGMEWRRASEDGAEFKPIERGWLLGSEAFRKELLAQMSERRGPEHYGPEVRESGLDKAQRLVGEELRTLGWSEEELRKRKKGDATKLAIARPLRQETTMPLGVPVDWTCATGHPRCILRV